MSNRILTPLRRISSLRATAVARTERPTTTPTTPTTAAAAAAAAAASAEQKAAYLKFSVEDLMHAKVHMGHRRNLWNPNMSPYILGHRNGMHVIDLDKTVPLLSRALKATSQMAEHDCTFLWLGPQDLQKAKIVEKQARKAGAYTIDGARWIGGTLTNPIMSNQAQRFKYRIPDCVFIIDTIRHIPALKEAKLCGIPTIGIVDSDCDPRLLTYPIPGNDNAAHAIYLYCSLMKHAILDGRNRGRRLNRPSVTIPKIEPSASSRRRGNQRSRSSRF